MNNPQPANRIARARQGLLGESLEDLYAKIRVWEALKAIGHYLDEREYVK